MSANQFFSYDPDGDYFEFHETAEAAKSAASEALNTEAELATENEEWGERVSEICWGEIRQIATRRKIEGGSEYELQEPK